jgi:hypothetical protein
VLVGQVGASVLGGLLAGAIFKKVWQLAKQPSAV